MYEQSRTSYQSTYVHQQQPHRSYQPYETYEKPTPQKTSDTGVSFGGAFRFVAGWSLVAVLVGVSASMSFAVLERETRISFFEDMFSHMRSSFQHVASVAHTRVVSVEQDNTPDSLVADISASESFTGFTNNVPHVLATYPVRDGQLMVGGVVYKNHLVAQDRTHGYDVDRHVMAWGKISDTLGVVMAHIIWDPNQPSFAYEPQNKTGGYHVYLNMYEPENPVQPDASDVSQ